MYEYTKICPECGKEKPLNKFYAATDSKKRRQCKTCWRRWRNAQPDMQQLRALAAERARHKNTWLRLYHDLLAHQLHGDKHKTIAKAIIKTTVKN